MIEAFISEVTISSEHGRIATLKHFDGGSFSVELENGLTDAESMEAVAYTIRNLDKHFVNLVTNEAFKDNK